MLTLQKLKNMRPDSVFAAGLEVDSPDGINMMDTGKSLVWIAHRGQIHDWAVFCEYAYFENLSGIDLEHVARFGEKVHDEANLRKLLEMDDEAFRMYNH